MTTHAEQKISAYATTGNSGTESKLCKSFVLQAYKVLIVYDFAFFTLNIAVHRYVPNFISKFIFKLQNLKLDCLSTCS